MKAKFENRNKNKVKGTFLRLTAIFISIVLLSFTVSAQDFWKQILTHNSINEIAAVLVEGSYSETEKANTNPISLLSNSEVTISLPMYEVIEEEELELESWMIDNSHFNTFNLEEFEEMEQPMELEPWMQNENHFNNETEKESPLKLEAWMTDEGFWG